MDSLKSLLDKRQYALVISLTEGSRDATSLWCRASAYLSLNKPKEALDVLLKNRDSLYKEMPIRTMKSTFEIRFFLKEYEEAYDDLDDFENRPYVSQEVEEFLQNAPGLIRGNERKENLFREYDEQEIHSLLRTSKDDYAVLSLLDGLRDAPLSPFNDDIIALLTSERHASVRTFALLLLVSEKYPKEVSFKKGEEFLSLNPSELIPPFTGEVFSAFQNYLRAFYKEPSVTSVAETLLNDAILASYPTPIVTKGEDPLLAAALCDLALKYLQSAASLDELFLERGIKREDVKTKMDELNDLLESVPPLLV